MIDKKKFLSYMKVNVLFLVLLILLLNIPSTLSKYTSDSSSDVKTDVAFYLLKTDYQTESILLDEIAPSDDAYVYNFSVSNYEGNNRVETNLSYDLSIRTTTNLPLEYELYLNEDYNSSGASSIFTSDETVLDSDSTYFRNFTTDTKYFSYLYDEINNYQLVVYFPKEYIDYKYQDIYESVEITIKSKQIIDSDENNSS
ncbi:MAG: hypothetical protein ACI31R_04425 [Bacilli bacterium]